jgi:hypothetical protein
VINISCGSIDYPQKPRISRRLKTEANHPQPIPHLHVSRERGRETIFDSMKTPQMLFLCFVMPGGRYDEFNWFANRYALCCARQMVIITAGCGEQQLPSSDTTGIAFPQPITIHGFCLKPAPSHIAGRSSGLRQRVPICGRRITDLLLKIIVWHLQ